jgi:hypothetical protein
MTIKAWTSEDTLQIISAVTVLVSWRRLRHVDA